MLTVNTPLGGSSFSRTVPPAPLFAPRLFNGCFLPKKVLRSVPQIIIEARSRRQNEWAVVTGKKLGRVRPVP